MTRAILKRYECGHREFTGHHYQTDSPYAGIPLGCEGLCQQCRKDSFDELFRTGSYTNTYTDDHLGFGSDCPTRLTGDDAPPVDLAELAVLASKTEQQRDDRGGLPIQRRRETTERAPINSVEFWTNVFRNFRFTPKGPGGGRPPTGE